jgi:asparagine synthetase B (glutamine-hydrolysing)
LEARLVDLLHRPAFVLFSGGVDSSFLLALATQLARRHGLEEPTAITYRYPNEHTRPDEQYQDALAESIGLRNWVVIERESAEVIGPDAERVIRILGDLPGVATISAHMAAIDVARQRPGSVIITGEGGDTTFSFQPASIPAALAQSAWRNVRRPRVFAQHVRRSLPFVAPKVRPASLLEWYPFLTADGLAEIHRRKLLPPRRRPLGRLRAIDMNQQRGYVLDGIASFDSLAAHHGIGYLHPLREDAFVTALVRTTPRRAFTGRNELLEHLWPGVLTDVVRNRPGKAHFTEVYFGEACREFARRWDGRSLASPYIDNERLRDCWLGDTPFPGAHLLQAAWAAENDLLPGR